MVNPGPVPNADLNLLFGILALQMDFITRDQLIAAMNAWVLAKDQPLGRLLHGQGALGQEELALLQAMVAKHVEKHGHDPAQSLQAVSSVGSAREDLQRIADPDVQASLVYVTVARVPTSDPHETNAAAQASPGPLSPSGPDSFSTSPFVAPVSDKSGLRFRILRPHAAGGLGAVYVARDEELGREVALKEIKGEHANSADCRSRFVLEAEITGGLEHPGIVPVYGLGTYADGRPFYAMRFIRGDSLKEAIERFHQRDGTPDDPAWREVELRKLLRRFYDVCNAVAYAHSRGVLHRDLKPGNIMLGKYGETLVVDWGLAKPLGRSDAKASDPPSELEVPLRPSSVSGSAPTEYGALVGTPAFMSPEQASGRLDLVSPASDVYSLGATLYYLLTGHGPFPDKNAITVLAKVRRGDFPPPRQIRPDVPPALQAVCLKAMALRPEDRYATVAELGRDVERWLDDLPVSAWREPWQVKARRWVKRHRLLVTGLAVGVFVAALCLAATTLLLTQANERLTQANLEKQRAYERAEANYGKARQAVDEMLTRVSEKRLADMPQMEEVRRELLERAREFYREFLQARSDDPELQRDTSDAYFRTGYIHFHLGDQAKAEENYRQALALREQLVREAPESRAHRQAVALSHYYLGLLQREMSRAQEAEQSLRRAVDLQEQLVGDAPGEVAYRQELAMSQSSLGHLYWAKTALQPAKAEACYRRALGLREELCRELPGVASHRQDLATSRNNLAIVLRLTGKAPEAEQLFRQALELQERLVHDSRRAAYRQDLARTHNNLGILLQQTGRLKEAEDAFREALQQHERLANDFPDVPVYRQDLAGCHVSLGIRQYQAAQHEEAEQSFRQALLLQEQLRKSFPDVPVYRRDVAVSANYLGVVLRAQGKHEEAEKSLLQAVESLEKLVTDHAAITAFGEDLARCHNNLAMLFSATKRKEKAVESYLKARQLWEQLARDFPRLTAYRQELARSHYNLGHVQQDSDQGAEAEASLRLALKLQHQLVDEAPTVKIYREELGHTYDALGRLLARMGRMAEADAAERSARQLREP